MGVPTEGKANIRHDLKLDGDKLVYNSGNVSHMVSVLAGSRYIRIGCLRITKDAFNAIRRKIESNEE